MSTFGEISTSLEPCFLGRVFFWVSPSTPFWIVWNRSNKTNRVQDSRPSRDSQNFILWRNDPKDPCPVHLKLSKLEVQLFVISILLHFEIFGISLIVHRPFGDTSYIWTATLQLTFPFQNALFRYVPFSRNSFFSRSVKVFQQKYCIHWCEAQNYVNRIIWISLISVRHS